MSTTTQEATVDELVNNNLDLVHKVRWRCFRSWQTSDPDEFIQIGMIALWEAAQRANEARVFRTWAWGFIRIAMLHHISNECRRKSRTKLASVIAESAGFERSEAELFEDNRTPLSGLLQNEETARRSGQMNAVSDAVNRLPGHRRRLVELYFSGKLNTHRGHSPEELKLAGTVARVLEALTDEVVAPGTGGACRGNLGITSREYMRAEERVAERGPEWSKSRERTAEEWAELRERVIHFKRKHWFHDEIAKRLRVTIEFVRQVVAEYKPESEASYAHS